MRGAGWVSNGGFHIAEIGGDRHQLRRIDEGPRAFTTARHVEGQYPAESRLLATRERMLRMGFEPRVMHFEHARLTLQPARQLERCDRMRLHTQLERLQSLEEQDRKSVV